MNEKLIIENIAKNLKKLRKAARLTQEQLIEKIGDEKISLRSYKTYESGMGNTIPLLEKLIVLAEFFEVSLDSLILNKNSTYDNSFLKRDQLKRINRLIYSSVLIPIKEDDPDNDYYRNYYFISYEKDVMNMIDVMNSRATIKNREFESSGTMPFKSCDDLDECFDGISNLTDDWSLSFERFNKNLKSNGIDPKEYFDKQIQRLKRTGVIK